MPNYSTTSQIPYAPPVDPGAVGGKIGSSIGAIGAGIGREVDRIKAEGLPFGLMEGTKAKADKLIAEYGDPRSATFKGLTGSQRTTKLVALLQPLDPAMAGRYETRAAEERRRDFGGTDEEEELPGSTGDDEADLKKINEAIEKTQKSIEGLKQGSAVEAPAGAGAQGATQSPPAVVATETPPSSSAQAQPQNTLQALGITNPTEALARPSTAAPSANAASLANTYGLNSPLPHFKGPFASPEVENPDLVTVPGGFPYSMGTKEPTLLESMGGTYGDSGETEARIGAPAYGTTTRTGANRSASGAPQANPNATGTLRQQYEPYGAAPFLSRSAPTPELQTEADLYGDQGLGGRGGYFPATKKQLFDTAPTLRAPAPQTPAQKMEGYTPAERLHGYLPADANANSDRSYYGAAVPGYETYAQKMERLLREAEEVRQRGTTYEDDNG